MTSPKLEIYLSIFSDIYIVISSKYQYNTRKPYLSSDKNIRLSWQTYLSEIYIYMISSTEMVKHLSPPLDKNDRQRFAIDVNITLEHHRWRISDRQLRAKAIWTKQSWLVVYLFRSPVLGTNLYSNVRGANMGPTWVLSAPDGPYVGPMKLAIMVDAVWIE